jgi:hypothetical protein
MQVVGVFCEDIREEKSGQSTLIGIMPDNINVPTPPQPVEGRVPRGFIPKLGLYVRINIEADDEPGPMTLKLIFPGGTEQPLGDISAEIIAKSKAEAIARNLPIAGILSSAVLSPFISPGGPGLITAVLDTEKGRHVCAVLNMLVEPANPLSSNAPKPPVSQSPAASPRKA